MKTLSILISLCMSLVALQVRAELKAGDPAPSFKTQTHAGKEFDLQTRKGQWTVLYFYPKAETPGCTKQACAFRDSIKKIRDQGADVFGISADTIKAQADFHKNHQLNFTLLADPEQKVIKLYQTQMADRPLSKRWTFIIGPDLKIRAVEKDVDPSMNANQVAEEIAKLKI